MKYNFLLFTLLTFSLTSNAQKSAFDLKASIAAGQEIYTINCQSCHMEQGEGLEGVWPQGIGGCGDADGPLFRHRRPANYL